MNERSTADANLQPVQLRSARIVLLLGDGLETVGPVADSLGILDRVRALAQPVLRNLTPGLTVIWIHLYTVISVYRRSTFRCSESAQCNMYPL